MSLECKKKTHPKWNADETSRFLKLFRNYELLWNIAHIHYPNKVKRDNALSRLSDDLVSRGIAVVDMPFLRNKIKNIKSTYRQELMKVLASKEPGKSGEELYTPRLSWYNDADAFLREIVESRASFSNPKRNLESIRISNRSSSSTTTKYASDSEIEIAAVEGEFDESLISQDSEAALMVNSSNGGPSKKQKKSDAMESSESDEDDQSKCEEDFPLMPRYSRNQPIPTLEQRNKLQQIEGIRRKYQVPNSNFDAGHEDHPALHMPDERPTLYRSDDHPTPHILANNRGSSKDHRGTYTPDVSSSRKRGKMSSSLQEEDDGLEIFSKLVVNHLRQLPLEWALRCQNDIHSLLVKERIKYCREHQAKNQEISVVAVRGALPSQEVVETGIDQNQVFKEESFSFSSMD